MSVPLTRELVLVGGGHAHALVLRRWGMRPLPGVRVTLVNPGPTAPYTGMLPGFVAGHYPREALNIDLVRLARFAGARLIEGKAEGMDRDGRIIKISEHADIAYDIASVDIGITSDIPEIPGFLEFGVPAKPLGRFAEAWSDYVDRTGPARIAVIGAGVAGAELSLAMAHALKTRGRDASITLFDSGRALATLAGAARIALFERLRAMGIRLIENNRVERVEAGEVTLVDGRVFASDFTVGAAGARPYRWLETTGLALNAGFLTVDRFLRSSDPAIYAVGDCADMEDTPRPKAGVYAVRASATLAHNLRADLTGGARRPFRPQDDYLKLISLGRREAIAEKWGATASGAWVWRWKDRIDRRFMAKLADLKPMTPAPLPSEVASGVRAEVSGGKPLCGGCGAKIGHGTLERVLKELPATSRKDIEFGPGDDAALLRIGDGLQVITTDHLRSVTEDPWLMARIAAQHALGDIWAMGAEPQAALASIVVPRMSEDMQEGWLREIMDGAASAFGAAGAAIVGGHSSMGAELTIGFTVTGLAGRPPITLAGARSGDLLMLTRPIGSGTLLAGEMALAASGEDISALLAEMASNRSETARLLRGAHAMTDVTGFGLAGHLRAILRASGVGAHLRLDDIPFYHGAVELSASGIRSTLFRANRAAVAEISLDETRPESPLLFDPQTAGPLLAAVPRRGADRLLQKLVNSDTNAAIIGEIVSGEPFIEVS